jgi:hypothetical protein
LADCPKGSVGWGEYRSGAAEPVDDPFFLLFGGLEIRGSALAIKIGKDQFKHVLERHAFWSTAERSSKFLPGVQIGALIKAAASTTPTAARRGKLQWVVDAGREIGIDRVTGRTTSVYTVITNRSGKLITAHPGIPLVSP